VTFRRCSALYPYEGRGKQKNIGQFGHKKARYCFKGGDEDDSVIIFLKIEYVGSVFTKMLLQRKKFQKFRANRIEKRKIL